MDSLEPESVVLTIEVSAFQGLHCDKACTENHLVPVVCVLIIGVSTTPGSGLEGFHCTGQLK